MGDSNSTLEQLSQAQRSRLFHIDFRLFFLGAINRTDLVNRFGIKEAAATRDLSTYREIVPENANYDAKAKRYFSTEVFRPLFEHTSERALRSLTRGVGDDFLEPHRPLINCAMLPSMALPRVQVLAPLARAIHLERPVEIVYSSTSSGSGTREIVPFALATNGLRWHARAFDRRKEEFRDFVLSRMVSVRLTSSLVGDNERPSADNQWNRIEDLELVPHPDNVEYPETIENGYGMVEGVLHLEVRAALVGYLMRLWNVDCSSDHGLTGKEYQLWLRNHPMLYGVKNAELAPGYRQSAVGG